MDCDSCGKKMRLNKPKENSTWSPFWGCTGFPSCKNTKKVEQNNAGIIKGQLDSFSRLTDLNSAAVSRVAKRRENTKNKLNRVLSRFKEDEYSSIEISEFPYISFPYKSFNELQLAALKYIDRDMNIVVCSPTSSGKTSIAEMVMGRTLEEKSVTIYTCPLRALASQKYNRWTEEKHDFSKYEITINTGDVSGDSGLKTKLNKSNIIIQTSEMLYHKSIHPGNTNNYLFNVGSLIVDESHLICDSSRGSELECGLEKFTSINNEARIVFLSATMANTSDMIKWLTILNGKKTILIETNYRPCELNKHYIPIPYYNRAELKDNFAEEAVRIVEKHKRDKFIVFVHDKSLGRLVKDKLEDESITTAFHSRDLKKDERYRVEHEFEHGGMRAIVATSTLAIGLDLPARRVIICGTKRGPEFVSPFEINQMWGRAGRPSFDTEGDAHILIEDRIFEREKGRINKELIVDSQLFENDNFLFHLLICIYSKINTVDKILEWYKRTLSFSQNVDLSENEINNCLEILEKGKFIKIDKEKHQKTYIIDNLGKICCWFYMNPLDIRGWVRSFNLINKHASWTLPNVLWAFCGINSARKMNVSNAQIPYIMDSDFTLLIDKKTEKYSTEGQIAAAVSLYKHTRGEKIPNVLYSIFSEWKHNAARFCAALKIIDELHCRWNKQQLFDKLQVCLNYGVGFDRAELVTIPGIGAKRAEKLFKFGIETPTDILKNRKKVKEILGSITGTKAISEAAKHKRKTK